MSGPVRPPLKTELDNDTSENRPVNTIAFANTDFTLTNVGTKTTVALTGGAGGTIGGSIADTQVAFGTAADTIGGDSSFTYDTTTNQLRIAGISDNVGEFIIERTLGNVQKIAIENDSSASPIIRVESAGTNTKLMDFRNTIAETSVTAGLGGFVFQHQISGNTGSVREFLRMTTGDSANYEVVFNEDSKSSQDFRIESDAYPNMFFLDGGFNKIFMGNGSVSNDADLGIVQISVGNSLQTALSLISTEGDALGAPTLNFFRNSASPDVQDAVGRIEFKGNDSAIAKTEYASIAVYIQDETAGSQDGDMRFEILKGNSTKEYLRMNSFGVIFNELGADQNFKVETNDDANAFSIDGGTNTVSMMSSSVVVSNTLMHVNSGNANYDFRVDGEYSDNLLRTDGSIGAVGINTAPDSAVSLHVKDYNNQATVVRIESDDTDTSSSPILELRNSRAYDPAITTANIGLIKFSADTVDGIETVGSIAVQQDSVASFDSTSMQFKVKRSGVEVDNFRIRYSEVVVNEDSTDCDFRVETNGNTHGFHVDAATDVVGVAAIGVTGLADNNPKLQVNGSISGKMPIIEDNSATVAPTSSQLSGQMFSLVSGSAITLTLPNSASLGDHFSFMTTTSNLTVVTTATVTLNGVGAPTTLNANTNYKIYKVVCHATNKWTVDVS